MPASPLPHSVSIDAERTSNALRLACEDSVSGKTGHVFKRFSADAVGRKDKRDIQVISEQFLRMRKKKTRYLEIVRDPDSLICDWIFTGWRDALWL